MFINILAYTKDLESLSPSEDTEHWALFIPRGEKGERSEKGLDGINGTNGLQGPKGDIGEQGPKGDIGPQGIQGIQGPISPNVVNVVTKDNCILNDNDLSCIEFTNGFVFK